MECIQAVTATRTNLCYQVGKKIRQGGNPIHIFGDGLWMLCTAGKKLDLCAENLKNMQAHIPAYSDQNFNLGYK